MLSFRAPRTLREAVDLARRVEGLSRSDYILRALEVAVGRTVAKSRRSTR